MRLIAKDFLTYGCLALQGKAVALFLLLAGPTWSEEFTVLALGDSLTQGYGLVEEEGFVPQLQSWLDGQGADVVLINGGVSGDTTAGGAARADWSLTPEVDAMILALGANDMLRGIDPAISRANLAKILQVASGKNIKVLLVGFRAPGNYGPEFKVEFDAIYPDLAAQFGVGHAEDFFAGLVGVTPEDWQVFFQPDGIHPNAEGVARIVANLGPAVLRLVPEE